jgi:hypothetical protein
MTRLAVPAPRKGPGKENVRGAPKGRTLERIQRTRQECSSGIRNRDLKEQLRLRKERTSGRIFRKTVELAVEK